MAERLRRLDLLSPTVAFPLAWCLGVLAAQIHVLHIQTRWSATAWVVMVAVPVAFVCGGLFGGVVAERLRGGNRPGEGATMMPGRALWPLLALLAVGTTELAHQFAAAGTIPLLSGAIDRTRTGLPGGPTIALVDALTIAAVVALARPPRLGSRDALPELAIAGWALGMYALAGGRGTVILPILVAAFCRWRFWGRPRLRVLLLGGALACAFVSLLFFVRTAQNPGQFFQQEFFRSVVPHTPLPLVPLLPLHLGLAMNFEALARVIDYFPAHAPYGHGAYDAQGLHSLFTGTKNLGAVSARISPPWLTSTIAGPLWADGGIVLTVLAMTLIGLVVGVVEGVAHATGSFRAVLLAAYALYLSLFGLYANLWIRPVDWVINGLGLFFVGTVLTPDSSGDRWLSAGVSAKVPASMSSNPRRLAWAGGLATLLITLVLIVLVSDHGTSAAKRDAPPAVPAPATARLGLPAGAVGPRSVIMTDGDARDENEPLWIADRVGSQVRLRQVVRTSVGAVAVNEVARRVAAPSGSTLDVARWTPTDPVAVFVALPTSEGVTVSGYSIAPGTGQPPFVRGTARLLPPPPGVTRELRIARWTGQRPDLFIVDGSSDLYRLHVRVFSGESSFSAMIADITVAVRGLPSPADSMDVARTTGTRPDIIFVVPKGSSGRPEIHVLSGDTGFQSFTLQAPLPLLVGEVSRFAVGTSIGLPSLDVVPASGRPQLILIPLVPGSLLLQK